MTRRNLDQLDAPARDLAERSLTWMDSRWNEEVGLFRMPSDELYEDGHAEKAIYGVRETMWYALGLLLRNGPRDLARATRAIETILTYQFDAPGQPYHGTWYRSPHEPAPPTKNPIIWKDYDPNWREFIGTALAVMLIEYEALLPADLVHHIDVALRRAIEGSLVRNVSATYTNIALMTAFLLQYGADRFGEPAWVATAARLGVEILWRFRANNTFDEYNSPTYYGIDLYALALWRSYGSMLMREASAEIEAALWRDIAQFYHAGMRNVAGPYDRSYGMDLRRYVACLGMWIWLATGYRKAPFPDLTQPLDHAWDFAAAPVFALLGVRMPDDARSHFLAFQGERHVERVIATDPLRIATAWIDARVMLGAEDSNSTHRVDEQFHPATIHWLATDDTVGWIRLRSTLPVDARAQRNHMSITCTKHEGGNLEFVFQIAAPEINVSALQHDRWELPGLTMQIETNTDGPVVTHDADLVELRYSARDCRAGEPIRFTLWMEQG